MSRQVAVAAADSLRQKMYVQARAKWRSYLHDGPAAGLRRQHRFSKVLGGWVPAEVAKSVASALTPADVITDLPWHLQAALGASDAEAVAESDAVTRSLPRSTSSKI